MPTALSNASTRGGEAFPPCVKSNLDLIPEAINSESGVSVKYAHDDSKKWFVFRVSYGREDKALDYFVHDATYAYVPKRFATITTPHGKQQVLKSLIPNLIFAYTSETKAQQYVKATPALPYITYYYNHFAHTDGQKNPPLTISCAEMENFIVATCSHNEHIRSVTEQQCHYKGGELVQVIDGPFKGVCGKVARVAGQQRVVLSLSGLGLISTAYIPTAFIQILPNKLFQ